DVERRRDRATEYDDDAASAQGVAHPELVPDVGILDGQVGDDQVGDEKLLEHVGDDVAGPELLVGPEGLEAGGLERGLDVFRVHAIEVDELRLGVSVLDGRIFRPGLGPEGHRDEGVRSGGHDEALSPPRLYEAVPAPQPACRRRDRAASSPYPRRTR